MVLTCFSNIPLSKELGMVLQHTKLDNAKVFSKQQSLP